MSPIFNSYDVYRLTWLSNLCKVLFSCKRVFTCDAHTLTPDAVKGSEKSHFISAPLTQSHAASRWSQSLTSGHELSLSLLLLFDESSPAPCWGAGLYLMGSFSRGLQGGSLLQTHLKKGPWISWLPGHSLLLSIRCSPRLYPSVNGPKEQWMQQFLIPEMLPLSTVCSAVLR